MTDTETKAEPIPAPAAETVTAPAVENIPAPNGAAAKKKSLLDNLPARFIFSVVSYAAPVPVLVVMIQFWLDHVASPAQQNDVFVIFRQFFQGGGNPPWLLLPAALVPSFLILFILFRGASARVVALVFLPIFGLLEIIAFQQFFPT